MRFRILPCLKPTQRRVAHPPVAAVLLAILLPAVLAACGSVHQNVHVRRDVRDLSGWTRYDPRPLAVAEGIVVSQAVRDGFDRALRRELAERGLLAHENLGGGLGKDVVEALPRIVSHRQEGGVDRAFVTTDGVAALIVEVRLRDASGKILGTLRAEEKNEVTGILPKLAGPPLLETTSEALAEQMDEAVRR